MSSFHQQVDTIHQDLHDPLLDGGVSTKPYGTESEVLEESGSCSCMGRFRRSNASVLIVVSFALFVDLLVYCIIIPVLPLFVRDELGGSSSSIGILFACYAAGLLVCTPLFAAFSDRLDTRRWPMLLGLACLAGSTVLFGVSKNLWQLALARVAQGASAAATNTIGLAMIADIYPAKEVGTAMGTVMAINGLGGLIGPPLGGALYQHVSFLSIFLVTGGCALLDLIFRVVLIDEDWMKRRKREIQAQEAEESTTANEPSTNQQPTSRQQLNNPASADSANVSPDVPAAQRSRRSSSAIGVNHDSTVPANVSMSHITVVSVVPTKGSNDPTSSTPLTMQPRKPQISILTLVRTPTIFVSLLGIIVEGIVMTGLEPLLALHYSDAFGSSSAAVGYSFLAIALPYSLAAMVAGALVEKGYRTKHLVAAGFILMAVSLGVFDIPRNIYLELLPMIAFGISIGFCITPPFSEIAEYLTKTGNTNSFATGYASFNLSYSVGMFGGPLLSGILYDKTSFFVTMMVLTALAIGSAIMLFAVGIKEAQHEAHEKEILALREQYNKVQISST